MASTVWKGQLTFGLVSLPVRLFRAARKERVPMHFVAASAARERPLEREQPRFQVVGRSVETAYAEYEAGDEMPQHMSPTEYASAPPSVSRIKQTAIAADAEAPVAKGDLLKGHEIARDRYVTFTPQELKALRPETSTEMQIIRSVRLEEIDPVYLETSYYVIPDRGGERAYALLFVALKESQLVALATVTMHGRENVVVIRPALKGLLAHTMFYRDEVRGESEYEASVSELGAKELQLAKTFVNAISGPFAPEDFRDSHRDKLESLIAEKVGRNEVSVAAAGTPSSIEATPAKTVDIMDALRKSIQAAKKPPQSAAPGVRRAPQKRKA